MTTATLPLRSSETLTRATPLFRLSLAQNPEDVRACQRLRYQVFNCELHEGLKNSERSGLDCDRFDLICDHLMVHDARTGQLAGTYRMQTGTRAKRNLGYYSEELFNLSPFDEIRGQVLELGRACVHEEYRNTTALFMLWKGIAAYATSCNARYLIGCSSVGSQDENEGMALYEVLSEKYLAEPSLRAHPHAHCRCERSAESVIAPHVPRLFRAYLEISARLCGPPAIDRQFRTIDFLTLVDLQQIPSRVRARFFSPA
jgi:putative hemolysin